jgi:arsenate reductase
MTKKILFVCVENSCRSQMAEAFARLSGRSDLEIYSAGSHPSGVVNPKAVESMKEIGYDLSRHGSKSLSEVPNVEYDAVVTMGCGDKCPFVRAKRREDWKVLDPKNMSPEEFRKVRDEIERKVANLLTTLSA